MVQAMKLSQKMGNVSLDDVARVETLLKNANLPILPPKIAVEKALDLMSHDKKVKSGQIRLILLKTLGDAYITADYDASSLQQVLQN